MFGILNVEPQASQIFDIKFWKKYLYFMEDGSDNRDISSANININKIYWQIYLVDIF